MSTALRGELRTLVERMVREELVEALGAEPYQRTPERRGYQHSPRERTITTGLGPVTVTVPRGRLFTAEGGSAEWQSELLPRYARRTREVDAALAGLYLSGTNTRRVRQALKPLLKDAPLSKSAVSRVVTGLKDQYEQWRSRDLSGERLKVLYLDALYLAVRLAKKIEKVPVAAAIGVRDDGTKVLLGLWTYASEGRAAWAAVLEDLTARGLAVPALVVIDGSRGLRAAVAESWPKVEVQRCTVHIAGRSPRLQRGGTSPLGQIPMSPIAWGQAWWGNSSRRSRPDMLASEPSPEAPAKPRAAPKGNAFGAVNASRTSIAGRVRDWGGRASCVMAKTATTVDAWGDEAVVAPGV